MSKYDDRLADYVEVKDRIKLFFAAHPDGRLVTTDVRATTEPDGVPRVWVEAAAYRTADDPLPGRGWSWMVLPGTTPYTKGSELENTETSAWGRAIGALGIGIDKSIASANEVRAKAGEATREEPRDDGSLVGRVEVGDKASSDYALRQTPDGYRLGFRLRGSHGGILVETTGALAEQLAAERERVVGQTVSVWGALGEREFTPRGKSEPVRYQVLAAERLRAPGIGDLPVDPTTTDDGAPEPPVEAESMPLFSPDEQAALDAALDELERVGA